MIKSILIGIGILILLFVAYVAWVLHRGSSTIGINPVARVAVLPDRLRVVLTFADADSAHQVTEILFPRDLGEQIGMGSPDGFVLTPYTQVDASDPADEASRNWVEASNRESLRWVGSVPLAPDSSTVLEFPISNPVNAPGEMRIQYERRLGLGGQISFLSVEIPVSGQPTGPID